MAPTHVDERTGAEMYKGEIQRYAPRVLRGVTNVVTIVNALLSDGWVEFSLGGGVGREGPSAEITQGAHGAVGVPHEQSIALTAQGSGSTSQRFGGIAAENGSLPAISIYGTPDKVIRACIFQLHPHIGGDFVHIAKATGQPLPRLRGVRDGCAAGDDAEGGERKKTCTQGDHIEQETKGAPDAGTPETRCPKMRFGCAIKPQQEQTQPLF